MGLAFEWTGRDQLDRIAQARWQCYGARGDERESFHQRSAGGRWGDGDVCIASDTGRDVGTATSLSLHMHVRTLRIPCQGVAWVGTSKSHRRRSEGRGVASQVMSAVVNKARDREEVVSALMPFRVSFYEHFGYGLIERQAIWTIPLSLLKSDLIGNYRFGDTSDSSAMLACRARQSLTGQCDVETTVPALEEWFGSLASDTQLFVDEDAGQINGYTWLRTIIENDQAIAQLVQPSWDGVESLQKMLSFCAGLKDQYSSVRVALPPDLPVQWLLRERQVPHRRIDHSAATCRMITRMQVRVLDHLRFFEGQKLFADQNGSLIVSVRETEGHESRFELTFNGRQLHAKTSAATPHVTCRDITWAAIACGELRASTAAAMGLLEHSSPAAIRLLNALNEGLAPFCCEYF
ncbi:MAG TPA: GNAT family N-acetyltransferase [Tepidisphaeraceae bacterium]|jgi:predicted acetyltransferase